MAQPMGQAKPAERERVKSESAEPIAKVIEVIGNSRESFDDAIRRAVTRVSESVSHVTGVEVCRMTCIVRDQEIAEYRVDLKLAFGVEAHHGHHGE